MSQKGKLIEDKEYQRLEKEISLICGETHPNTLVVKQGKDFLLENRCFVRDSYD
jgi:hypothetical protein